MRQALRELLLEGRLRRMGRGTVVAGPKLEQPLALASYTEGVRRQGRRPGRALIGLDHFPCPSALAAEFGLERGEPVWHLERVLLADDERIGLESTYVAVERVPRLDTYLEVRSASHVGTRVPPVRLSWGLHGVPSWLFVDDRLACGIEGDVVDGAGREELSVVAGEGNGQPMPRGSSCTGPAGDQPDRCVGRGRAQDERVLSMLCRADFSLD